MKYDPLAKDQIGANIVGSVIGYRAYKKGATPFQAVNIGVHGRYWYKNLTWSFFLLAIGIFASIGGALALSNPDPGPGWAFIPFGPLQLVINVFVMGITYVSLVDWSDVDFHKGFAYRLFAPIQHRMPNVARFWWYLCLLFPAWLSLWLAFTFFTHPLVQR